MDDEFGHWLAGFIDGEGCFVIQQLPAGNVRCIFAITVRKDDEEILRQARAAVGVGVVKAWRSPRASWAPGVTWRIQNRADCLAIVELLDRYPLRAKKAGDYALWRAAVLLWQGTRHANAAANAPIWRQMMQLRGALNDGRRYEPRSAQASAA